VAPAVTDFNCRGQQSLTRAALGGRKDRKGKHRLPWECAAIGLTLMEREKEVSFLSRK
jgi:hypothetical protein